MCTAHNVLYALRAPAPDIRPDFHVHDSMCVQVQHTQAMHSECDTREVPRYVKFSNITLVGGKNP